MGEMNENDCPVRCITTYGSSCYVVNSHCSFLYS